MQPRLNARRKYRFFSHCFWFDGKNASRAHCSYNRRQTCSVTGAHQRDRNAYRKSPEQSILYSLRHYILSSFNSRDKQSNRFNYSQNIRLFKTLLMQTPPLLFFAKILSRSEQKFCTLFCNPSYINNTFYFYNFTINIRIEIFYIQISILFKCKFSLVHFLI